MKFAEEIIHEGKTFGYLIRANAEPKKTAIVTPSDLNLQLGLMVYQADSEVKPHLHKQVERRITNYAELLFVKKGRCIMNLYDDSRKIIASTELKQGDAVLLVAGGHGIKMLEDTILLKINQGPYRGEDEKERF